MAVLQTAMQNNLSNYVQYDDEQKENSIRSLTCTMNNQYHKVLKNY